MYGLKILYEYVRLYHFHSLSTIELESSPVLKKSPENSGPLRRDYILISYILFVNISTELN